MYRSRKTVRHTKIIQRKSSARKIKEVDAQITMFVFINKREWRLICRIMEVSTVLYWSKNGVISQSKTQPFKITFLRYAKGRTRKEEYVYR